MDDQPTTAGPRAKSRRRWYQFTLRTLLIAVTLLGVLFAQWPLFEWEHVEPNYADYPNLMVNEVLRLPGVESAGHYHVPMRVWQVVAAEVVAIAGWQLLALMRRRRIKKPACTRS